MTSFEFALHEVGPEVFGTFVVHPGERAAEALDRFREYAADASRDGSVVAFYGFVPETEEFPEGAWGEPMHAFLDCHVGDADRAEAAFDPLRTVAEPIVDVSGPTDYVDLQSLLDADYPDGLRYYWKATYLTALDDEVVEFLVDRGEAAPSPLSTVDLWHLGGAIGDVDRDATAFWHREAPYMLTFGAKWEDPDDDVANVEWAREGVATAREMDVALGGYGNFPGFDEDPARATFGGNYDRLVEVDRRYGPVNLFGSTLQVASGSGGG